MRIFAAALVPMLLALAAVARADDEAPAVKPAASDTGPKLGEAKVRKWKFGMEVTASGGNVGRMTGTTTIPIRWPEQELRLVSKDLSPGVTVSYRSYDTAKQMIVSIPRIANGKSAHAILIAEVTRHTLLPPEQDGRPDRARREISARGIQALPQPQPADREQPPADQGVCQADCRRDKRLPGRTSARFTIGSARRSSTRKRKWMRAGKGGAGPLPRCHRPRHGRLQRVDVHVHRHLPRQRHPRPHRPHPAPLLSRVLSCRRQGQRALVSGGGIGHGGFWRHPHGRSHHAERATISTSNCPARRRSPTASCPTILLAGLVAPRAARLETSLRTGGIGNPRTKSEIQNKSQ